MTGVADLYNAQPEVEWNRLVRDPYHRLEFHVFMHHIKKHLPDSGLILDAGGGPGRYTIEFARMGYDVVLLDLSSGCIELARENRSTAPEEVRRRIKELTIGSVTNLQRYNTEMFDAVICLDPLSCLSKDTERSKAVSELVRVSKPGATVALSVRGYLDVLRTILRIASHLLVDGSLEELERTGNLKCGDVPYHFFRADELKALVESHGLTTVLMAGGEGLSSGLPEATAAIEEDPGKWDQWLRTIVATSTLPPVVETSGHMLYVGRKQGPSHLLQ